VKKVSPEVWRLRAWWWGGSGGLFGGDGVGFGGRIFHGDRGKGDFLLAAGAPLWACPGKPPRPNLILLASPSLGIVNLATVRRYPARHLFVGPHWKAHWPAKVFLISAPGRFG
jgi:hypothetical protein